VIDAVMRGLQAISADALTRILEVRFTWRPVLIVRQIVRLCNKVDRTRYRYFVKLSYRKERWIKRKRR
jgi:hypothetical protein